MLTNLTIQNFGLIDELSIEFGGKLDILTGETGAGKSILIDALRCVLGERINSSQVRDPKKSCSLEAVFEIRDRVLRESEAFAPYLSPEDPSTLIIARKHTPDGKNKIRINGATVTVGQLKDLGNFLVDFHGPHDHQMLLNSDLHLDILDKLTDFKNFKSAYDASFSEYSSLKKELDELQEMKTGRERELDMLSFQIKELGQVPLEQEQLDQLKQDQVKINNAEKLFEAANTLTQYLGGDSSGISESIRQAFAPMKSLVQVDENANPFMERLDEIQELNDQLLIDLKDYARSLSFEPEEANEINNKCDIYEDILRKYGPDLASAQAFYTDAQKRYELLSNFEQNDQELRARLQKCEKTLQQKANKITQERQKTSLLLKQTIEKELKELGIKHVEFEARIEKGDFTGTGQDHVTFFISPNIGESLKLLADIVSSGEAARVMLALKKALIKVDPIPVLIFDEIDAQIGGRLGTIIGKKLQEISKNRQVILITHLPQIASFADRHYKVEKFVEKGRSQTRVVLLAEKERVKELANMMSGEQESKISMTHAKELLSAAGKS